MMRQAMTMRMAVALDSLGTVVCELLGLAAALEHAVPVLDAPAQAVPVEYLLRLLVKRDHHGGQQEPFQRQRALRRCFLADVHYPQRDLLDAGTLGQGRFEGDLAMAQRSRCRARLAPRFGRALRALEADALAGNAQLHLALDRRRAQGVEQPGPEGLVVVIGQAPVVLGADQQVELRATALLFEQAEKIGFAIHHADQPCLWQRGRQIGAIAQALDPAIALPIRRIAASGRRRRLRRGRLELGAQHAQRQAVAADRQGRMQVQAMALGSGLVAADDAPGGHLARRRGCWRATSRLDPKKPQLPGTLSFGERFARHKRHLAPSHKEEGDCQGDAKHADAVTEDIAVQFFREFTAHDATHGGGWQQYEYVQPIDVAGKHVNRGTCQDDQQRQPILQAI